MVLFESVATHLGNSYSKVPIVISSFLPLDEVIVSRAVFVIVFGSDGRKHLWSQLNNPKTVRDRPYVSMGN